MPLTKVKPGSNMYQGWVSHTHSHLGGECPHKCSYCYVQAMEKRFGGGRYAGPLRLIEKEFAVNYGKGKTIFVEHCNDLFAERVPPAWIDRILAHCRQWPDNEYVFQTKNPWRYHAWRHAMPPNRLLGCTIETSSQLVAETVSSTPRPQGRADSMLLLSCMKERMFVTIEPILDGDMDKLARWCHDINPEFVNIGADSKGTDLPEPSADRVFDLIRLLQGFGVPIKRKSNLERLLKKG